MWPVTLRFLHTLRFNHTKVTRVDLYRDAQPLVTNLPLLAATVDDDFTADVRKRCEVVLPATAEIMEMLPSQASGKGGLWPLGNEIRILSGIQYSDGEEELVPMGVFRISAPQIRTDSSGERTVVIQGYDRSRAVSRNRFIEPYIIPVEALDVPLEIKRLVQNRLPILEDSDFVLTASSFNPPSRTFLRDNDPWKDAAVQMAQGIGAEVLFDGIGRLVVRPAPDPVADPVVFDYIGDSEATILDLTRSLDDEQGYNGVVASSQSTSNSDTYEGQYWDTDPASPTYFDPMYPAQSIYGAVPYFFVSEYISSDQQAKDAAKAIFNRVTGVMETYDFSAICNPAHESGDTVKVQVDDANADDVNILNVIHFDLVEGVMTAQTRRRAIGSVGHVR